MEETKLPTTQQILCEQLHAKVKFFQPFLVDKVTGVLVEGCSNGQIIQLLKSEELLICRIHQAVESLESYREELVGDAIFHAVAEVEPELCAQVTAMVLQLPLKALLQLLMEEDKLRTCVRRARDEYLRYQCALLNKEQQCVPALLRQMHHGKHSGRRLQRGGKAAVAGGILIHLTLGNLYSFGNLITYLASYMQSTHGMGSWYSSSVWVMGATVVAQGFFMPIAGVAEKRLGPRLTCLLGCITMSSGVALTYFTVRISLAAVVFSYGFLVGLGISLTYVSPLACAMKWYPDRKGLINGLIVAGFGLGALGSTTLQTLFLNPSNTSVGPSGYFEDPALLSRVPAVFLLMAAIFMVMQLVGCFLLGEPGPNMVPSARPLVGADENEELLDDRWDQLNDLPDMRQLAKESVPQTDFSPQEMLRTGLFYHLWTIYLLNTVAIGYINATYKSFGQTFLKDDYMLSMVGSLAAIFNAVGRLFWGRLMDNTSFRTAMCCLTSCLCALFVALPLTPLAGAPAAAYTATVWFIFFTFCGTFVLMPTVAEKAFGSKHYTSNYGLFFTSQVFSGVLVSTLNQLLLDTIGYTGCFLTVASISAIGFFTTCLLPKRL